MLVGKKSQNNTSLKREDIKKQKKSTASVKLHLQYCIKYMFKRHEFRQVEEKSAKDPHTPPVIHTPPSKELQELSYQRRTKELTYFVLT